ncbi:argininosuccinate lyase [Chitinophaga nivalis]|uniref:Argininosuccinate lyase n=1 Tax=Chitinophaga nivalis TaxID=2991709 RepID=A0ABT3IK76_9BACT|nr:argininosuccinate lyase [Chitinophaga nivalis]MCW3466099.1 argininosuccinate lyase [Chitinophaga nivalis]MCW3484210.1 argininosuccinate lyase [Chitinophaga nivalis]
MRIGIIPLIVAATFSAAQVQAQLIQHKEIGKQAATQPEKSALRDASRIGRTAGAKAPAFQELYDYEAKNETLTDALFPYQSFLHKAYVVMLAEQHILTRPEASTLLTGLKKVDSLAIQDPALRVYLPYEAALIKEIGSLGGKMHTGRSRNDLDNTTTRMLLRDRLLDIIAALIPFRESLLHKATDNLETVMVAYTHRKEAQPITLAHYLTAIDESFGKSLDRYIELYERINQSPLGSGATGGTSWPLDRKRVAGLLGFDKLVVNTIEGVAGWDHIAEFAFDNAVYLSAVSRYASEIQLWSTDEYQMAELDNAYAGISSMMPQKKNPDALERSRKAAANATGQLTAILTSLNAVEYQHSGARVPLEPKSLDAVLAATHAMTGVTTTLHVNKAVMLDYARKNFSTMTDLADLLVREKGMDFREAHEVISMVVNDALQQGKTADKITVDMIQNAAQKLLHKNITVTHQQLQDALDPIRSIKRKQGDGMPSPESVQKMISSSNKNIQDKKEWLHKKQTALQQSNVLLQTLLSTF